MVYKRELNMTDQLTTLRRKYGYFIPYHTFVTKPITSNVIENDFFHRYGYVVEIKWDREPETSKYITLASSKKKIRNIFKIKFNNTPLNKLISVVKLNEQTKLTAKTKINTIKSIIDRIKDDWKHIRS